MWTKYNANDQSYDVLDADNNFLGFAYRINDLWAGITVDGWLTDTCYTLRQAARAVDILHTAKRKTS